LRPSQILLQGVPRYLQQCILHDATGPPSTPQALVKMQEKKIHIHGRRWRGNLLAWLSKDLQWRGKNRPEAGRQQRERGAVAGKQTECDQALLPLWAVGSVDATHGLEGRWEKYIQQLQK